MRAAFVLFGVALVACGGGAAPCGPRPGVVACVDDTAVTVATAREHLRPPRPLPGKAAPTDPRADAVDAAIRVELFAAEARRRGLGDRRARTAVLNQALIADERARQRLAPADVADAAVDALLQAAPGRVAKIEGVHVRAIYLADAATAEAVYAEAVGLDDAGFAALAQARSRDPSAASGGDLGVIDDDHSPIELVRAATPLAEAGALTGPVALADGRFAILRAVDVTVRAEPPEQLRPRAREYLAHQAEEQALAALAAHLEGARRVRRFPEAFAAVTAAPEPDGGR
ncbi:MAG: peptidylprolyl isomerase [Myxococcales bacterium]|nr:peptidylprolyl isomerase [Myxococcales bacterium]